MGMDETYHQNVFDENMALIDTPLIASSNTHYSHHHHHHHKAVTYPYNLTAFQGGQTPTMENILIESTYEKQSMFFFNYYFNFNTFLFLLFP